MPLHRPHSFPGRLIAVEGLDGSGGSAQLGRLKEWLDSQGVFSLICDGKSGISTQGSAQQASQAGNIPSVSLSILRATDFANRLENIVIPALQSGSIVLADRYCFAALARDLARGLDQSWVRGLYGFAPRPDRTFYFRIPVDIAIQRIDGNGDLDYYEAGLDLGLSSDPRESYRLFQSFVVNEYDKLAKEFGFDIVSATAPPEEQQKEFRESVSKLISNL